MIAMALTNCTQRTITTKKRTYSIVGSEQDDSDKMRKRYSSGWEVGEDGTIQSGKKELYEEKSFRRTKDKDAHLRSYRSGKKELDIKEYRTPEYLTRQKDFRTKDSTMNKDASESDVDRFTATESGKQAWYKKFNLGFLDWLNPFSRKKVYREANKSYTTSTNRAGSRTIDRAPVPQPMSKIGASPQHQVDSTLSMDDVKKMLNPEGYIKQKRR